MMAAKPAAYERFNPRQWTLLCMRGALLVVCSIPCWFVTERVIGFNEARHGVVASVLSNLPQYLLLILPPVVGFALSFWASIRLQAGLNAERWSEAELAAARDILQARWITSSSSAAVLMYMTWSLFYLMKPHSHGELNPGMLCVFAIFASTRLAKLKRMLNPYRGPSSPVDLTARPRLFSEHWGEPPASFSGR